MCGAAKWGFPPVILGLAAAMLASCALSKTPIMTAQPVAQPTNIPTTVPTVEITEAATEPTEHPATQSINIVYQTADNQLMGYITGTGETWMFGGANFAISPGPHSTIATFDTNIYVTGGPADQPVQIYMITPVGVQPVRENPPFIPSGIAVTHDPDDPAHPLMAVAEYDPSSDPLSTSLTMLWLDSTTAPVTVAAQDSEEGSIFVPWRWSADSKRLYFAQEPTGLGGYILFDGYSTLYAYDRTTGETATLIDKDKFNKIICLDDLSPDEQSVAHHCTQDNALGILNLTTGDQGSISVPADIASDVGDLGSARFSPDGTRVAFALARNDVSNEQGWIAVSDGLAGSSYVVMTSAPGTYLQVEGWLDAQTLVVQAVDTDGKPTVWLVPLDGGEPQNIGEGQFLAMIPPAQ